MKEYLSELDKETKKALESFYGFSEGKSKVRRSVDEGNGTESEFFRQIPLMKFEDFSRTATILYSGQKRKIEGSVFHKDSSIVNSGDSNDIIGFQLVSVTLPWPASSLGGSAWVFWVGISLQPVLSLALVALQRITGHCSFAHTAVPPRLPTESPPALWKRNTFLRSSRSEPLPSPTSPLGPTHLIISALTERSLLPFCAAWL